MRANLPSVVGNAQTNNLITHVLSGIALHTCEAYSVAAFHVNGETHTFAPLMKKPSLGWLFVWFDSLRAPWLVTFP